MKNDSHLNFRSVPKISVIIPAFNEEKSLPLVLRDLPKESINEIIVVDNASVDATSTVAKRNGARVVLETRRGYGNACLKGVSDSDYPEEISKLIEPIKEGKYDFVLGSRMILAESRRTLLPQARFGNLLAVFLMRIFFGGYRFTDLGPFRAINYISLKAMGMQD